MKVGEIKIIKVKYDMASTWVDDTDAMSFGMGIRDRQCVHIGLLNQKPFQNKQDVMTHWDMYPIRRL